MPPIKSNPEFSNSGPTQNYLSLIKLRDANGDSISVSQVTSPDSNSIQTSMKQEEENVAEQNVNDSNSEESNEIIDDANKKQTFKELFNKHYVVALLCLMVSFGGFFFGWDTGTISGFVGMPHFERTFAEYQSATNTYAFSSVRISLIISIFNIGCAVGGVTLPKLGDNYGRKVGIISSMVIYIVGIILQISASHYIQYTVGRVVSGLGVGSVSVLCPMFITESSPSEIRGLTVSFYQLMITLGILLGYVTTFGTSSSFNDERQWTVPLGLCFAWALFMIGGIFFLPESPRFLLAKGDMENARISIAKVNNLKPDDLFVTEELETIVAGIEKQNAAGSASWYELFHGKPHIFTRLFIGVALQSFQKLTGNNYFFYYGTSIFNSVGLSNSYVTSIILGAVNFVSAIASLFTVNGSTRRATLMWGSAGMVITLFLFSIIGSKMLFPAGYGAPTDPVSGIIMVVTTCIFIAIFAITWAPGVFVVVSETYPLRIRSKGMAIATAANWIWGTLIAFFTPMIVANIGFYYGYVFLGCTIAAIFFVFLMVPETSGLALEDIDELYTFYKPLDASMTRYNRSESIRIAKVKKSTQELITERTAKVKPDFYGEMP